MTQTVLTLIAELQPALRAAADQSIADLKTLVETSPTSSGDPYEVLARLVPSLHFASIMVFEDERFDPLLTVELNFDGTAGSFLPQLDTPLLAPYLRAILRCCKPPEGRTRPMYDAVIAPSSKMPLAPYLETLMVRPAVFHEGNRGLDRARILREAALFEQVQDELETPTCRAATDAVALHANLRKAVLPHHAWLDEPAAARIPPEERALDIMKLAGLVVGVLVALLLPGLVLAKAFPETIWWISLLVLGAAVVFGVFKAVEYKSDPKPIAPRAPQLPHASSAGQVVLGFVALGVLVLILACLAWPCLRAAMAGLVVIAGAAVAWLRHLETTDRVNEVPKTDPGKLREIMALEDQIAQNHMGSVVHVKPGGLRAVLIRLGLHGLGLLLRVTATDGYLGSMRTIHFAHWALIDNGSRLLFFSNFDSSWESYLDDFIEKAHAGLTLAWSNGIGFPRTSFLVNEGATNGRLFKDWARHSMAKSVFWFSGYRELSVNQIERNCAIALGLRQPSLPRWSADRWAALL